MREILFRGKRVDNGEWVEGSYIYEKDVEEFKENIHGESTCVSVNDHHSIHPHERTVDDKLWCDVYPETVGQYTGLKDKNGKKIFEGDKIKCDEDHAMVDGVIEWVEDWAGFGCNAQDEDELHFSTIHELLYYDFENRVEVIGNIQDK